MTDQKFAVQAAIECNSGILNAHAGGGEGRPFWNPESFQFMYVPAFQFQPIPGTMKYRYEATDAAGVCHKFDADSPKAMLTPIWAKIPEGVVKLCVYALDENGEKKYLAGARTFFRLAPFSADLPEAVCSYRECAEKAYEYVMNTRIMKHWLEEGTPDPEYDHNVYPSKMISSVVEAMIAYSKLVPKRRDEAMRIARNAADYLIGITPTEGVTAGLPPTYQLDFRENPEQHNNFIAADRIGTIMMIYPASAGSAYLKLEEAVHEEKYLDAALKIGEYYRAHVLENGSWDLIIDRETGKPTALNSCDPLEIIMPFLMKLYERTGNAQWKTLADGALHYVEDRMLTSYEWEGQFEDSWCSHSYSNLTHYGAKSLAIHYAKYRSDDEEKYETAEELMRFVEDQFVVWKNPSPWNKSHFDPAEWLTPCGLEQYEWHVPIDASTGNIMIAFLTMYQTGHGELYLEKAKALADAITRSQQPDGMIPTHWMNKEHLAGDNFWLNCMLYTAGAMTEIAEATENL